MAARTRSVLSIVVLLIVAGFALLGRWYAGHHTQSALAPSAFTVAVTSSADRGPGTLREALFVADAAPAAANVVIRVASIALQSALPPIVNPHGTQVQAPPGGVQIDARAIAPGSAVFDIDSEHVSLDGVSIHQCAGTAILVRASLFRLTASTISACDVGVEVAANANELALENDRFESNHVGIRFTSSSRDSQIVKNEFSANTTAGLWLVASQAQPAADPISVHDNQFNADATDVVVGNVPALVENNDFTAVRDAAVHVIGAGTVVRNNRITTGAAAGILVENARGAVIDGNELDHLAGYAILVRGSADTLVRSNRIQSCAYGMAFVLGDRQQPNSALDNSLIDLKYNGIDVIGESPILRRNQVLEARALPLHVQDFTSPGGTLVRAQPLLERNSFQTTKASSPVAGTAAAQTAPH
ncbi:MAG TPA: right-handed parallel beta-helix repeat-containing protein [Steroidobacteraceae bacterium]|jgi:hypothetical protein|nr:right-handed parallel beta-helix repeat-containing protein [Steroidobacteraceae bacterium]